MRKRIISVFLGAIMLFTGVFLNSTSVLANGNSKDNTNNKLSDKSLPSGFKYSELKQSIDNYIAEHKATTASVAVSVFDNESAIYQTYYGYTGIENKIKAEENSVYEWGSATKTLVNG